MTVTWTLKNARVDVDQSAQWVRSETNDHAEAAPGRVLRGSQDYSTLHLGRGTKWAPKR